MEEDVGVRGYGGVTLDFVIVDGGEGNDVGEFMTKLIHLVKPI